MTKQGPKRALHHLKHPKLNVIFSSFFSTFSVFNDKSDPVTGFILHRKQDEKNNILLIITNGVSSMLGAVLGAWLSDKLGRNLAIMGSDLLYSIGWPLIMYSEEAFSATLFGYIVYAVALGISQISSLLLIAETCPYSIRGRMTSVMGILMAFGTFASFFLSKTKVNSVYILIKKKVLLFILLFGI